MRKSLNNLLALLEIYGIVEDILLLWEKFDVVVFAWIPPMRNCEADLTAKQALASFE